MVSIVIEIYGNDQQFLTDFGLQTEHLYPCVLYIYLVMISYEIKKYTKLKPVFKECAGILSEIMGSVLISIFPKFVIDIHNTPLYWFLTDCSVLPHGVHNSPYDRDDP